MMLIQHDPDEFETVTKRYTCAFHAWNPGGAFAGCTCSTTVTSRLRAPDDVARIKAERRRKDEDRILAEADIIRRRRALEQDGGADV